MNLTVSNRIIAGFSIITVMLVIMGANSLINLSEIKTNTTHAKDVALPLLLTSDKLQVQLFQLEALATREFYSSDENTLNQHHTRIEQANSKLASLLSEIKRLTASEDEFPSIIKSISAAISKLADSSSRLYHSKKSQLSIRSQLATQLNALSTSANDTSRFLLDISDLEQDNSRLGLNSVIGLAADLDNLLMSVVKTSEDLVAQTEQAEFQAIAKVVKFIAHDLATKMTFMQSRAQGELDQAMLDDLVKAFEHTLSFISDDNSIISRKEALLRDIEDAVAYSKESIIQINVVNQQLEKLLDLASESAILSQQHVLESVHSSEFKMYVAITIAILFASAISLLTIRSILTPLNKINEVLKVLATGNLTVQVAQSSKDEFGELANNINQLSRSLSELIKGIAQSSTRLATAADQTSTITSQTTAAISEQRSQVDQAAAATNELSSSAELVASHASDAFTQIKQTNEQASQLAAVSEQNKQTISSLSNDIRSAADVINTLHDDSTSIGSIIDVIRGIAEQTNLLALNAAIEAARAGEQGRGFAVVADEVRNLANRTQQSTQEIHKMIELIQSGAQQAVSVMEISQQRASTCVEETERTSVALESMSDSLKNVQDSSNQITLAAQEQNHVSLEISQRLEEIVSIAQETSSGAQETSHSSSEVAKLAEKLQSSAIEFTV